MSRKRKSSIQEGPRPRDGGQRDLLAFFDRTPAQEKSNERKRSNGKRKAEPISPKEIKRAQRTLQFADAEIEDDVDSQLTPDAK